MSLALIVSLSKEAEINEIELVIKIHGVMQYKVVREYGGWKKDEWTNELNDLNESMMNQLIQKWRKEGWKDKMKELMNERTNEETMSSINFY